MKNKLEDTARGFCPNCRVEQTFQPQLMAALYRCQECKKLVRREYLDSKNYQRIIASC